MIRLFVIVLFFMSEAHAELPDRQLTASQAVKEISLLSLALETIHPWCGSL
jgi:succinate dehydrogenase hydrophobic anchor subunit